MSSALRRGRTLDPRAVKRAGEKKKARIRQLLNKGRLSLTRKERSEARRLTGRWDFWSYGAVS